MSDLMCILDKYDERRAARQARSSLKECICDAGCHQPSASALKKLQDIVDDPGSELRKLQKKPRDNVDYDIAAQLPYKGAWQVNHSVKKLFKMVDASTADVGKGTPSPKRAPRSPQAAIMTPFVGRAMRFCDVPDG